MLHTKFRGYRSTGSGEEYFLFIFFTICECGSHLCHVTQMLRTDGRRMDAFGSGELKCMDEFP